MESSQIIKNVKLTRAEKEALKKEKKSLKILKIENDKKTEYHSHLLREKKFIDLTLTKISQDFEIFCANIKIAEVKNDLQGAFQGLHRVLDLKEHIINRLQQNRKTADEQYRRNVFKHSETLQYIIKFHKLFSTILKNGYESEVYTLLLKFYSYRNLNEEILQNRKIYYENILFATNLTTQHELEMNKNKLTAQKNEINEKHIEIKYKLRDNIVVKMKNLHQKMDDFVRVMQENVCSENKMKLYSILYNKNEKFHQHLKHLEQKSRKYYNKIHQLQSELINNELFLSQHLSDLNIERRICNHNFEILNKSFKKDVAKDSDQLKTLACVSLNSIKVS